MHQVCITYDCCPENSDHSVPGYADLKLENVLFAHNTLRTEKVNHGGKTYEVEVPVNTNIKCKSLRPVVSLRSGGRHWVSGAWYSACLTLRTSYKLRRYSYIVSPFCTQ